MGRHAKGVLGLGGAEASSLLEELNVHCTQVCVRVDLALYALLPVCAAGTCCSVSEVCRGGATAHISAHMSPLLLGACNSRGVDAMLVQRAFVYSHEWSRGDLLIWDNTSTLHRATEGGGGVRALERCVMELIPPSSETLGCRYWAAGARGAAAPMTTVLAAVGAAGTAVTAQAQAGWHRSCSKL